MTNRPTFTCDFWCDFWCEIAYKPHTTLPFTPLPNCCSLGSILSQHYVTENLCRVGWGRFCTTICKLALTVNNFTCCFTFQTPGLARQLPTENNEARRSGAKLLVRPIRKKMAIHTWQFCLAKPEFETWNNRLKSQRLTLAGKWYYAKSHQNCIKNRMYKWACRCQLTEVGHEKLKHYLNVLYLNEF